MPVETLPPGELPQDVKTMTAAELGDQFKLEMREEDLKKLHEREASLREAFGTEEGKTPPPGAIEAMERVDVKDEDAKEPEATIKRKFSREVITDIDSFVAQARERMDKLDPEMELDAQIIAIAKKVFSGIGKQTEAERTMNEYFVNWLIKARSTVHLKEKYGASYKLKLVDEFEDKPAVFEDRSETQDRLREVFFGDLVEDVVTPEVEGAVADGEVTDGPEPEGAEVVQPEPEEVPTIEQPTEPGAELELPEEIVATIAAHNPQYAGQLAARRARERWTEQLMDMDSFEARAGEGKWHGIGRRLAHAMTHPAETSGRMVHNILKSHRINSGTRDIIAAMQEAGNDYSNQDVVNIGETLENVSRGQDYLDAGAGENAAVFSLVGGELADDPNTAQLQLDAQALFVAVSEGTLEPAEASIRLQEIAGEIANVRPDISVDIAINANTFVEAFEDFRRTAEHVEDSEAALSRVKLALGEVATGSRSEADLNRYERAVTRGNLLLRPQGKLFNTVGTAVVAAGSIGFPGVGMAVGATAAGVMGYHNRRAQTKVDRENMMRDLSYGIGVDRNDQYTQGLVESAYQTHGAGQMSEALESLFIDDEDSLRNLTGNDLNFALAFLSDAERRRERAGTDNIDLFSYSDQENAEAERRALDASIARVNELLSHREDVDAITVMRAEVDAAMNVKINQDIDSKDQIFRGVSRQESFKAARRRAIIATGIGGVAVGVAKLIDFQGFNFTEKISSVTEKIKGPTHESVIPGTESTIQVPDGLNVEYSGGSASLVGLNGNVVVHDLQMDSSGAFNPSPDNIVEMDGHGITYSTDPTETITTDPQIIQQSVMREEFMNDALAYGHAMDIQEQLWQTNGTVGSDGDELKIWFGGEQNTGITANGDIEMTMAGMQTASPGEVIVTMTTAPGESIAVVADVSPDGTILISHDSLNSQLFDTSTGKARFLGDNFQVQRNLGDGRLESLATWRGSNEFQSGNVDVTIPGSETYVNGTSFSQVEDVLVNSSSSTINPFAIDIGADATTYKRDNSETQVAGNGSPSDGGPETGSEGGETDGEGGTEEENDDDEEEEIIPPVDGGPEDGAAGPETGSEEETEIDPEVIGVAHEFVSSMSDAQKDNIKNFHNAKDFRAYIRDTLKLVNTSIADGANYNNAIRRLNNVMPIEGIIGDEFSPVASKRDVFYNDVSGDRNQVIISRNGEKFLEALFSEITA